MSVVRIYPPPLVSWLPLDTDGMPRSNVVEAVLRQCRADGVLIREPRAVVAVSGGPDSTALLHAMDRCAPRLHLQLTGAPLHTRLARGPAEAAEDAPGAVRYAYLEEVAAEVGPATIALGHSADDQAETVLMHLI